MMSSPILVVMLSIFYRELFIRYLINLFSAFITQDSTILQFKICQNKFISQSIMCKPNFNIDSN